MVFVFSWIGDNFKGFGVCILGRNSVRERYFFFLSLEMSLCVKVRRGEIVLKINIELNEDRRGENLGVCE